MSKGGQGLRQCSNGLWKGARGLGLSFGPASGPGETSLTCIRAEMSCPRLGNEGKGYDEPTPLQVAGSRRYGV